MTQPKKTFNRGDIWLAERAGKGRLVVVVGHDAVSANRDSVLVIPISDVRASTLIEPAVSDEDAHAVGIAMTPRVGEVSKDYLAARHSRVHPDSMEAIQTALRAIFDL